MYEYEYWSKETLDRVTKKMAELIQSKIERAQREIEYLESEKFQRIKRRYAKYTQVYIKLRKTKRYSEKRLDHFDDKVRDILEVLIHHLSEDGWYIEGKETIELGA